MSIHFHVFYWKNRQHGYIEFVHATPDSRYARRTRLASFSREKDAPPEPSDVREIIAALLDEYERKFM